AAAATASNDFETGANSFTLDVVALDAAGNTSAPTAVTVNVTDLNDNAPAIDDAVVSLDENVAAGTAVTNVNDSFTNSDLDRDGDAITYSITNGNGDGIFTIDAATGAISIATGKTLDYETASQHVLTVTASDGTLSDTAAITVNVNNLPDTPPSITNSSQLVSETGLKSATDADTSNLATGKVTITHDSATTVTLVTPSATVLKSGGTTVNWTLSTDGKILTGSAGSEAVITISIDDLGNYTINLLKPIDHPDITSADVLNLNVGVMVKDAYNNESTGTLTVQIQDDVPTAAPGAISIDIPVSSINVSGLEAGFVNAVSSSGGTSGLTQTNTDTDSYMDRISWGTGTTQSGYAFVDNETLRSSGPSLPDSDFKLGTFTHNNFPVSGTTLSSVDLVVKLTVMIDGIPTTVEHTVKLNHEETPNNAANTQDPANDDIIRLDNSTLIRQFTVGDRTFEFEIKGFLDPVTGNVVTTIYTTENAASSFDLYAVVKSTDGLPLNSGDISTVTTTGADGDVLISGSDASVSWTDATQQADGSFTIVNEFGTFTGWADGRYRFEVSRTARDNFDADQTENLTFNYIVTDGDGDTDTSTVTVTLDGQKVLPHVPEVEQDAQTIVLSKEVGTQATANLGIEVGRDTNGASMKITAVNDTSLNGTLATATVVVNGVTQTVRLTSGGVPLVYRELADGSLEAVKQGTNEVVFKISGDAIQGTYSVEMIGILDTVTSYTETAPGSSGTANFSFSANNGTPVINSTIGDVKLTLSAFLDKAGENGVKDGNDSTANVVINTSNGRGISVDNTSWNNGNSSDLQFIQNNTQTNNSSDGTHGEKLVLDFSANVADGRKITEIGLTLNQFGDRVPGWFGAPGDEDKAHITVFYTDGTSQVVDVTAVSRTLTQGENGDTGTQYVTITAQAEKSIASLVIGAGDTASQFSVDRAINVKWAIDDATVTRPLDQDALTLHFGATVTDGTGDSANTDFSVIIDPDTTLQGTSSDDTLTGSSQADTLIGGLGDDILYGQGGNDILIGGEGNDILYGGSGADTFVWQAGDFGNDVIKDFNIGEGDRIDLSDLLQGEEAENAPDITQYLRVDTATSTLLISSTGVLDATGSNADVTIKLENGADPINLNPGNLSQADLVNSLIAGGDLAMIKVDHT
ncbi:MAG: cadherin domain-containing protein, partial [Pseudomonas sp.]|nr:cadherin domain-containing protein [Pseudomonas sp.]